MKPSSLFTLASLLRVLSEIHNISTADARSIEVVKWQMLYSTIGIRVARYSYCLVHLQRVI